MCNYGDQFRPYSNTGFFYSELLASDNARAQTSANDKGKIYGVNSTGLVLQMLIILNLE